MRGSLNPRSGRSAVSSPETKPNLPIFDREPSIGIGGTGSRTRSFVRFDENIDPYSPIVTGHRADAKRVLNQVARVGDARSYRRAQGREWRRLMAGSPIRHRRTQNSCTNQLARGARRGAQDHERRAQGSDARVEGRRGRLAATPSPVGRMPPRRGTMGPVRKTWGPTPNGCGRRKPGGAACDLWRQRAHTA